MVNHNVSERRACEILEFNRSSIRYRHSDVPEFSKKVVNQVIEMANTYKCYGYKTITQLLKRLGYIVNKKRIFKVWQEYELSLPQRRKRKKRRIPYERPHKATRVNEVWCYDFLYTKTEHRDILKILVVLDEFSRECLKIKVNRKLNSEDIKTALSEILCNRPKPDYIRSDNGPEFISRNLREWLHKRDIRPQYIEPGKPWQNGFIESFNARFRSECLNRELFWSRAEAQTVCSWWKQVYNYFRPHSSIGWKTPAEMGSMSSSTALHLPVNLTKRVEMVY